MDDVQIRPFGAADADWLVEQHHRLYTRDDGFDASFGALVEQLLADFVRDHDPAHERGWIAERNGERLGSIFCVALKERTAKLGLFLLVPEARGQGLAQRMLDTCTGFACGVGFTEMRLRTHESHRAACALYRRNGWQLLDSKPVHSFGVDLVEQSWKIRL